MFQPTGTTMDMHLHTVRGASDSMLQPEELIEEAHRAGLTGVNLSEHDRVWDRFELDRFRAAHPELVIAQGMEVSTDLGHIIVVGLPGYVSGIRRAEELRRVINDCGGYMVAAHPFRHHFDPAHFRRSGLPPFDLSPEQAAELPVCRLVDDLEVTNGCNTMKENWFALQVARIMGKPGFGGSDAHSRTGIGSCAIMYQKHLTSADEILPELHAGRYQPVQGLNVNLPRLFYDAAAEYEAGVTTTA